jgi:uncharacterized membrane protein YbjE (DUF340 family)
MTGLRQTLSTPEAQAVLRYLITLFGAAAMYVFSLNKGFEGSLAWLKRMMPGKSAVFYDRLDFCVVVFAGSIIGTICFIPQNTFQALAAGFGWVGSINVLMNRGAVTQNHPTVGGGAGA